VAKDKSNNTHANITAKKAGKTTITVKTKNGTMKYNVTVKNLDITGTLKDMGNGQLLVTIKNNTAQTFDYVTMSYTLKDETGDVKDQDTMTVSDVVAGKTVYKSIYYSQSVFTPDLSQSSVKVTGDSRVLSAKYTDASKKVTTDVTLEEEDTSTMKFYIKTTNKLKKQNLSGYVYIRVYDETGSLVDLLAYPFALQGSAVDTGTRSSYFKSDTDISNYTYKVTTVAYYYKIS
jgi:hypothetical protein